MLPAEVRAGMSLGIDLLACDGRELGDIQFVAPPYERVQNRNLPLPPTGPRVACDRNMNRICAIVSLVAASVAGPASAAVFTLTPITNTTPNFPNPILIQGTVSMGAGETFLSPNTMSTVYLPFLPGFTAGFNGNGQTFDPGFLTWNGLGTYVGPIYDDQVSANNLGYSGGMPPGLYNFNPGGPGGQPAITLNYTDASGITRSATAPYAINVVIPAPGAMALFGIGGLLAARRRR